VTRSEKASTKSIDHRLLRRLTALSNESALIRPDTGQIAMASFLQPHSQARGYDDESHNYHGAAGVRVGKQRVGVGAGLF